MSRKRNQAELGSAILNEAYQKLDDERAGPSRRKFLKIMGGAATGFIAANTLAGNWAAESYSSKGTTLEMIGGWNIKSNLFMVSFGGEGNWNDYWGGVSMFQDSGKRIPTADMHYDNKNGLDIVSQARVLRQAQKERGFEYLIINANSEGGLISLATAALAGIKIGGFIANSCPADLGDAVGGAALTVDFVTSRANPDLPLVRNGELAMKDLYCYFRDAANWENAIARLPHEIASLPSQMASGGSADLQESQSDFLKNNNAAPIITTLHKLGIINKDFTATTYLEAAQDNVIAPIQSHTHWEHDFGRYGIAMPLWHMGPGSGHADVFTEGSPLRQNGFFDDRIQQLDTIPVSML